MEYIGLEFRNSGRNNFLWSASDVYYKIKRAGPILWKSLHMHMWLLRAPSRHKARGRLMPDNPQGTANLEKQLRTSDWLRVLEFSMAIFQDSQDRRKTVHQSSLPASGFSFLFWLFSGSAPN